MNVNVFRDLLRRGSRGGLGVCHRLLDLCHDFLINGVELGVTELARLGHARTEVFQWAVILSQVLKLALGAIRLRVTDKMAVVTALLRKNSGGAVAGAGVGDGFTRSFMNSKKMGAIGHEDREAKRFSAGLQVVTAHRVAD